MKALISKLASKIRDDKVGREAMNRLICNGKSSIEVDLSRGARYMIHSKQHEELNDGKDH